MAGAGHVYWMTFHMLNFTYPKLYCQQDAEETLPISFGCDGHIKRRDFYFKTLNVSENRPRTAQELQDAIHELYVGTAIQLHVQRSLLNCHWGGVWAVILAGGGVTRS